jgi:hypothetical protein
VNNKNLWRAQSLTLSPSTAIFLWRLALFASSMSAIEGPPAGGNANYARNLMYRVRSRLIESSMVDDAQMIEDNIELAQELYGLTTGNSGARVVACIFLADSLSQSFQRRGNDGLLEEIINLGREALTLSPKRYPNRVLSCERLANSLTTRYERTNDAGLLDEVINLEREVLDLRPAGHPDRAPSCGNLATSLKTRYRHTGDAGLLDEVIDLEREALDLCPAGHPEHSMSCGNLAVSLAKRYERTGDAGLLDEAIDLQREALDLCPAGNLDRASSCGNLAASLKTRYQRTGDVGLLDEAIDLEHEALDLCPARHPDRALSCGNLAISLITRYERTGDAGLLDKAIDLQREALDLRPAGNPNRALSCGHLAVSLAKRYERMGDAGLLDEAIDLQREALDLHPAGNPYRESSCGNLAASLKTRYQCTGDVGLLDEAIDLQHEALDLCPARHPDRALSCGSLAISLTTRYERTGDAGLLDEVIDLQREALDLRPAGNPNRALSCGNLAGSLTTRYRRTGDFNLLDEAIDLEREALDLRPAGHPDRALSCGNLAIPLKVRYKRTGNAGLLDEAIDLQREALDLRPAGNPDRALSCGNLAASLMTRYQRTGDVGLLDEAIDLEREALDLRSTGHPDRALSCGNLAISLMTRYERTDDVVLIHQSLTLFQEAVTISPVHTVWRFSHQLALTLLQDTSPFYDVSKAILSLSQSLQCDPDDPLAFVLSLSSLLDKLWQLNTEGRHIQLTTIYQRLVSHLPLLIHPALGLQPQLQALKRCTQLGSDAFVNAALADDWSIGLETLDLAQGVIWSTSLHRRDPQLKDVPEHLASRLQDLLRSLAMSPAAQPDQKEWKSFIPQRDILHTQSSRLYAVIRDIRDLPGLERFMLGESVDALCTAASDHPVVVLVGARGHYYALILAASLANGHVILSLNLSDEDLTSLSFTRGFTRARRSHLTPEETPEEGDRAGLKKTESASSKPLSGQLQTLWHKVVKPVLARLGLRVSRRTSLDDTSFLTKNTYVSRLGAAVPEHACIGVLLESSAICLYTLQGFTTARTRSAALTLWRHRTPRPSLCFYGRNRLPSLSQGVMLPSPLWQKSEPSSEISKSFPKWIRRLSLSLWWPA